MFRFMDSRRLLIRLELSFLGHRMRMLEESQFQTVSMAIHVGTANHFFSNLLRFRRRVPHLLLNLPLTVRSAMQYQRHFSVGFYSRLSLRRLYDLGLGPPLPRPLPPHHTIL